MECNVEKKEFSEKNNRGRGKGCWGEGGGRGAASQIGNKGRRNDWMLV